MHFVEIIRQCHSSNSIPIRSTTSSLFLQRWNNSRRRCTAMVLACRARSFQRRGTITGCELAEYQADAGRTCSARHRGRVSSVGAAIEALGRQVTFEAALRARRPGGILFRTYIHAISRSAGRVPGGARRSHHRDHPARAGRANASRQLRRGESIHARS